VIFITALSEEADETRGLEVGAIDYISKPISAPIVKARVRNHLQLKRYRDILENLSTLDGLTGIANRRRLDEFLAQEWLRGRRQQSPLSVCLMDIDFFKRFNNRYGHAAGDDCLRRVALALVGVGRRPADLVARYGGEEFVCVLPETDAAGAALLAEKLRDAVIALEIPHADSTAAEHVTISGGVATAIPTDESSAAQLLEAADQMLYQAKKTGRNRILMPLLETVHC
jgi:diguanylate cyclase (GGDEF)-like protein